MLLYDPALFRAVLLWCATRAGAIGAVVCVAQLASGCLVPGLLTDGSSVSVGRTIDGVLRDGATLPDRGEGYVIPARWRARGRNRGTDELVNLVIRAARRVARRYPGGRLGVADLSPPRGGSTAEHYTHASGRDVDLLYYATDERGRSVVPVTMVRYGRRGQSRTPVATLGVAEKRRLRFDARRNWAMVDALVTSASATVEWIFIARHLQRRLLRHARQIGAPTALIERAAWAMRQPSNSTAHDDHMHVRVFCSRADRRLGCKNRVPARWKQRFERTRELQPPELLALAARAWDGVVARLDALVAAPPLADLLALLDGAGSAEG